MISDLDHIIQKAEASYLQHPGENLRIRAQMLIDLGYLEKEFRMNAVLPGQVAMAMAQFRQDLQQSGILSDQEIEQFEQIYGRSAGEKLLDRVTDVDEGIGFKTVPAFGVQNLQTRILHYRLNLLGLYEGPVASPWSAFSYTALEAASHFAGQPKLRTMNLLADLEQYTAFVLNATAFKHPVVVFKCPENKQVNEYSGSFKRQLKRDLHRHRDVFEQLDNLLFFRRDKKVNATYLEQLRKSDTNRFVLRLIQVHQWMGGTYEGVLDGDYGPVTLDSLLEVISQFNDEERKDVKPDRVLVRITGDTYLFNAAHFLVRYSEESQGKDRTLDTLQVLSEHIQAAEPEDQQKFEDHFQSEVEAIQAGEELMPENRKGLLPRIFTGVKTFFKKLFRVAKKLFRWIVEQAQRAVHFIRNAIRMIYAFLKEAVIHFINGVRFLLGKFPVTTAEGGERLVQTQFDLDKDVVTIATKIHTEMVNIHNSSVHRTVYSLQFSLAMIAFLFKTLKAALLAPVPVAWPFFIMKMVVAFKNVMNQYKLVITA